MKEVADILGIKNSRKIFQGMDSFMISTVSSRYGSKFRTDSQLINEAGLYHAIWQSRKPVAKKFRRWVYETVLPQIRKTGQYRIEELQQQLQQSEERNFKLLHKHNSRLQKHRYRASLVGYAGYKFCIQFSIALKQTSSGLKDFLFYK